MHVLIIPSWYMTIKNPVSGIFFSDQAEALAKICNKVGVVYVYDQNIIEKIKELNIKIGIIKSFKKKNYNNIVCEVIRMPKIVNFTWKIMLRRYIRKYGVPDIVHVHSYFEGRRAIWLKRKYGIKYVITEHSTNMYTNLINNKDYNYVINLYRDSAYRIAVSNEYALFLTKKTGHNFNYIPNTVDTDYFTCKENNNKNKYTFINIGYLTKLKRQDILIKAFYKAFKSNNNVNMIIVGNGEEYFNLAKIIDKYGIEDKVYLFGEASRFQVKELLQRSNCYVLTSAFETFGVALIEAMSTGIPGIATRCGGPESIITNDKVGILCDNDAESISNAMLTAYNKTYDSNYIRNYIINNFSYDVVSKKLVSIYNEII